MYSVLKVDGGCYLNIFTVNNYQLAVEFMELYLQRQPDAHLEIVKDYVYSIY